MPTEHVLIESGDRDDAENLASVLGHPNLQDSVHPNHQFTHEGESVGIDTTVTISGGKAFVGYHGAANGAEPLKTSQGQERREGLFIAEKGASETIQIEQVDGPNYLWLDIQLGVGDTANWVMTATKTQPSEASLLIAEYNATDSDNDGNAEQLTFVQYYNRGADVVADSITSGTGSEISLDGSSLSNVSSVETTDALVDPSGTEHTGELADISDVGGGRSDDDIESLIAALLTGDDKVSVNYDSVADTLTVGTTALDAQEVKQTVSGLVNPGTNITTNTVDSIFTIDNVASDAYEVTGTVDGATAQTGVNNPSITLTEPLGTRYRIITDSYPAHPLQFEDADGNVLFSQHGYGSLEADPDINWVNNGSSIEFTLTSTLADSLDTYRCVDHTGVMTGTITSDKATTPTQSVIEFTMDNVSTSAYEVTSVPTSGVSTTTGTNNPSITLTASTGTRYRIVNNGHSAHPLRFEDASGNILLSQSSIGSYESDTAVNWVDNGSSVEFTLTSSLANDLSTYRCTVHTGAMVGSFTSDKATNTTPSVTEFTLNNDSTSAYEVTALPNSGVSATTGTNNPTITLTDGPTGTRYRIVNNGYSAHPLRFEDASGNILLSQSSTGSYESDSDVNWVDNGGSIEFTLTPELATDLDTYRCTVHTSAMVGTITASLPNYTPSTGSVSFTSPTNGATVFEDVVFEMAATNFTIEAASNGVTDGAGHFHILVDQPAVAPGEVIPNNESNGYYHYGGGQTTASNVDIEPGSHTVRLQVGDAYHRAYDITASIDITVETPNYSPSVGSVSFTEPADGATVTAPVQFEMTSDADFTVESASNGISDNAGHLHILVDQPALSPGSIIPNNPSNGYYHYGGGQTAASNVDIKPGTHTIRLQAGDAYHRAYDLTDSIQITVETPTDLSDALDISLRDSISVPNITATSSIELPMYSSLTDVPSTLSAGTIVWITDEQRLHVQTDTNGVEQIGDGYGSVRSVTTNVTASGGEIILVDASSGAVTVTLPAPFEGESVVIKKTDSSSNAVTIATPNTETIDGQSTVSVSSQFSKYEIVSDGTNYFMI